jgi:uncharacterized membrane protein
MTSRWTSWSTPAFAVLGIAVSSSYLTFVHYQDDALVCGIGDCLAVQTSSYAKLVGISIAILGLLMYIAILLLGLLRIRIPDKADLIGTLLFSISLAGLIYSLYLTYVEIWVIEAICQWCVLSGIITALIFIVEARSMWAAETFDIG